ncbi:MAG TPA: hypothetical protein VLA64_03900 [Azonexus sp.]|nr:hypothetical protein [Azonexus sp.]
MRTRCKSIITASLVLPLLLVACDRPPTQSPSGSSSTSQEKPATSPSVPPVDQTMEKSPPSPADLSRNPAAPSSTPSTTEAAPVDQKNEPKKDN